MKGKIADLRETINDLKQKFKKKKVAGGSPEHAPKRKLREDIKNGLKNPYEQHDW